MQKNVKIKFKKTNLRWLLWKLEHCYGACFQTGAVASRYRSKANGQRLSVYFSKPCFLPPAFPFPCCFLLGKSITQFTIQLKSNKANEKLSTFSFKISFWRTVNCPRCSPNCNANELFSSAMSLSCFLSWCISVSWRESVEYDKGGGSVGSSLLLFLVTRIYKRK